MRDMRRGVHKSLLADESYGTSSPKDSLRWLAKDCGKEKQLVRDKQLRRGERDFARKCWSVVHWTPIMK